RGHSDSFHRDRDVPLSRQLRPDASGADESDGSQDASGPEDHDVPAGGKADADVFPGAGARGQRAAAVRCAGTEAGRNCRELRLGGPEKWCGPDSDRQGDGPTGGTGIARTECRGSFGDAAKERAGQAGEEGCGELRRSSEALCSWKRKVSQVSRMKQSFNSMLYSALVTASLVASAFGQGMTNGILSPPANVRPPGLKNVGIQQNLNQQIPADLMFTDDLGRTVRLGDYFGKSPMILNLVYYNCPMLCGEVLSGLENSLRMMKFDVGKEFDV